MFFNEHSPGSCFFLPHGARIYNTLIELMRVRAKFPPVEIRTSGSLAPLEVMLFHINPVRS